VLQEAFMYRHHAQTLKVKELVDSGTLGKVQFIRGSFSFTLNRVGDIRTKKEMGGGSIWDVGCYPISYMRMIVGANPAEVFGWQVESETGTDASFYGQMKFANGVHTQFDSSFQSPSRSMIEIVGTDATLTIPHPFKPRKTTEIFLTRDEKQEKIKIKGSELYLGEVEDMCDAIAGKKAPRISLADSRGNIATILALIESATSGKPVTVTNS
jgi:D-xylose 1-dehydrogenase (NADP+, D-xylono-1,5-lactone-forming)